MDTIFALVEYVKMWTPYHGGGEEWQPSFGPAFTPYKTREAAIKAINQRHNAISIEWVEELPTHGDPIKADAIVEVAVDDTTMFYAYHIVELEVIE